LGRTVVGATLAGPGVTTTNAASLWFGSPGNLSLVVRQGMRIPNNSSEIWFGGPTLRVLAMNESGDLFISASLVGNAFTGSIRSFWMYTDGELQLLAAEGTSYDSNPDPTEADYARIFEDGIVGPGLIGSPYIATLSNSGLAAFRTFSHTSPSGGLLTARVVDTSAGAADFNHDGAVDAHDLVVWREGFPVSNDRASPTIGDANYDGDVDGADFLAWQRRLDASSSQMAALPEPTSLYLGAAAILAVTRLMAVCIRRRR
jgi:hypothetical protein